jgi:protein gp37
MGDTTSISWSNATWNPWHGCAKVSAGCKNCYMFREKKQYGQDPTLVVRSKTKFDDPLKWVSRGRAPKYCFTCSWSDFFIAQADPWRSEAWDIIRQTPEITYQILTKRPERISMGLPDDWGAGYPNVWLGVSCENQQTVDERIPLLIDTPAAVRFISAEPLLGPIRLDECAPYTLMGDDSNPGVMNAFNSACYHPLTVIGAPVMLGNSNGISWVIAGGESGPGARPMHPGWIRSLRDQCLEAAVPFFFKQWGEYAPIEIVKAKFTANIPAHVEFPDGTKAMKFGTKASGATLDGRLWQEFPVTA